WEESFNAICTGPCFDKSFDNLFFPPPFLLRERTLLLKLQQGQ
ncbi:unnamed protein product, partial [Allacma fusca]